jgi:EAL domain-containing protein (putative c-di-GMP-specific phosphodiesterase class I)
LVADVTQALQESGLQPEHLELEITEGIALDHSEATVGALRELKNLGVRLAIDDFGTGYSALNYLKRYPVDTLKIDRSFVRGLGTDPEDMAIVHAVIAFARTLQLHVTAEGIETAEQLARLRALECERGQGYYFSRPVPGEEFGVLYRNGLIQNTKTS